ncbi:MAG: DUF2791 family P-loop domain-containing protein [Dehalococcoidales bacterium]|nr:DUF2791 family P-loop domain-containing protein [Dehalococcoidales bacterium]
MIGKRLEHDKFGKGFVQEIKHRGLELRALFDDGLERWVRIDDVRFLSSSSLSTAEMASSSVVIPPTQTYLSRSMIEAFRLGIVPYKMVEDFTFGRDKEIAKITDWLAAPDIGTLIVEGDYGSGKSHLLEYAYALALRQGYAVAQVELDPNESPPYKPKAVYRKLVQTFCYEENHTRKNFRDFMHLLSKKPISDFKNHRYLYNFLSRINTIQNPDWLWQWIEGETNYYGLPMLYDHGTAANMYCNILAGLAWAAHNILRLKGLVLIIDEAENVDPGWCYSYQVTKGLSLIYGLVTLADNDIRLQKERLVERYRPGIGVWFGEETDLIYHGFARDKYCYYLPSYLKVAFAFTPTYYQTYVLNSESRLTLQVMPKFSMIDVLTKRGARFSSIRLQSLSDSALKEVYEHICLLYDSSYDFLESDSDNTKSFDLIKSKTNGGTRSMIKGSVEILDLKRFHHGISLEEIE